MKTIEDLQDDLALAHEEAKIWLERKHDANREAMIAHLAYIDACHQISVAENALHNAHGEPS